MKGIIYTNLEEIIKKNYDIDTIINEIVYIIKSEDLDSNKDLINKLINDLYLGKRNILIAYKNNEIIGFVNLKRDGEQKIITNIYIKNSIIYKKILYKLINDSIEWLETSNPKIIIYKKDLDKFSSFIIGMDWELTNIYYNKKDMSHSKMIFNGISNEFESLKTYIKKPLLEKDCT